MKPSKKFDLNLLDIKKWIKNTLLFSSPAIFAFLTALQGGQSLDFALGAAYSAVLAAGIDLTKKFIAGK